MLRVLLTGFEPFGGEAINPSWEVVRRLQQAPPSGLTVAGLLLPVERFRAIELAVAGIERERPDLILALGQAGGRSRITPERIAINVDDYRSADNAGNQPSDEPIYPGAPAAYFCTVPVKPMIAAMVAAGAPAAISNSAGTYLCNHVAFGILHHLAATGSKIPAGFVHLPYLPEQVLDKRGEMPSMTLDVMVSGIATALTRAAALIERAPQPV
jgi:pyroglutamyl-peptidase